MAYKYNVKGVGLDQIFDPYISGTKAALTGYTVKISGVDTDLRDIFAPLYLGTTAAPTNYKVKGADLNTFFAAKGTASYTLPFNGVTYTSGVNITSGSASAQIGFRILSGSTYQIYGTNSLGGSTSYISGPIPAGAVTVQCTFGTYAVGVGFTDAGGSTSNGAATPTAVSGNPSAQYSTATNTSTSGSKQRNYPLTVDFFNAGGTNISHSVCHIVGETEGSI